MAQIEYTLRDKSGNITNNMDEIVEVAGRFYADLYASDTKPGNSIERTSLVEQVPTVIKYEVEKALKGMKRRNAAGDDEITVDLLKDGEDIY